MGLFLTLDNGCFLSKRSTFVEIGCYQGLTPDSDVRIYIDGEEQLRMNSLKLGDGGRTIELRHWRAGKEIVRDGVVESANLRSALVNLDVLYGEPVEVDRRRFDCILRLESGHLRPSVLKRRAFVEAELALDGTMKPTGRHQEIALITHYVVAHFDLAAGDVWELARDEEVLLSTRDLGPGNRIEINLAFDDETGQRVYRDAFKVSPQTYWFPNGCNEGPSGPYPPCQIGEAG